MTDIWQTCGLWSTLRNTIPAPERDLPRKIFRQSRLRRATLPAVFGSIVLFLIVAGLASRNPAERSAALITSLIVLVIGAAISPIAWHPRLVISPTGVEVTQFGYNLSTTWDNIARMELRRGGEGLVLRQPLSGIGAKALKVGLFPHPLFPQLLKYLPRSWYGYTLEERQLVKEGRLIPFSPFAWALRSGELQRYCKRYAPQLLNEQQAV